MKKILVRILVEIKGGMINRIISNDDEVEVYIIDHDILKEREEVICEEIPMDVECVDNDEFKNIFNETLKPYKEINYE